MNFKVLCTFLLACIFITATAQQITISGVVTDAKDGNPMTGVNVIVKGTTKGAITDIDGKYSISAPTGSGLVFSFVGYKSMEVVANTAVVDVALEPEVTGLEEIVVIGYGTVKKSDATGSVAVVSSKEFNKGAITSPQDLIVGKSAGVVITTSGGAPGSGATIRIRGGSSIKASNDPLIIVDGIPLSNVGIAGMSNGLSSINPNDIETFTVLKDASATAIYGSRASNGVIIITTKKGQSGQPFRINYNGNASVSEVYKYVDVLTGDEIRALANERIGKSGITEEAIQRFGQQNTDWQKEIYRSALSQEHNLSVSGSVKKTLYRSSIGYTDQQGILKNTDLQRSTISLGIDPSLFDDHLKISLSAKGSMVDQNFGNDGAVGAAVTFDPTQPVRNGNTRFGGYTTWTTKGGPNDEYNQMATSNPVAMVDLADNKSRIFRGLGSAQFDYKFHFLPELRANLNLGIDAYKSEGHDNGDSLTVWKLRSGELRDYSQEGKNKLLDFYLNYNKDLTAISSKIDLTSGYSWQHFYRKGDNFHRFIDTNVSPTDSSRYVTENYLISFFGRMNYSLLDRYLLTFTVRNDGSSRFSKETRWGLFPSVAFAWKINNEPFLSNFKVITDLKLRLGWGQTGQQDITDNDYPYMGTYQVAAEGAYYQFGNKWHPTLRPNAYDPNIKWETTTTTNVGIDFGFINDRITGSLDYYKRVTTDLINNIPIPNGSNFSNYLTTNVGNLENEGYEITLNLRLISKRDMSWIIGSNFSYNKNKITKLLRTDDPTYPGIPTGPTIGVGKNVQIHSVGYPSNSFYVVQQVYDINGNPIEGLYVDRYSKGGDVTANALYHFHQPAPDYLMGISSRFEFKNFDASFSSRLSLGNYVYNNVASSTFYNNLFTNSYWQNLSASIKENKFNTGQFTSDYYVENASFFKMDNISFGYNFNKLFTSNLKGRVGFTVQNVFVITKYSGLDPEVNGGIDNNRYPRPRVYLLGLNLEF